MNLPIIIRTFIQQIRDKATYIYFLVFPLTLMLILGSVLQGAFDGGDIEDKIDEIQVRYVVDDAAMGTQFEAVLQEINSDKLIFEESPNEESAVAAMKKKQANAYFLIKKDITVQIESLSDVQFTLLKSYLAEMFQVMRLMEGAQQFGVAPQELFNLPPELDKAIVVDQSQMKKPATSYQYYSVAMIALFILYMSQNGLEMFDKGRRQKTLQRELISPVSRQKLINSTFIGHALLGVCVVFALMVITQVLFGVPWHLQWFFSFANLSSLMLLFLVLGAFLETVGKGVGMALVQVIIQVAAFLGGGYFPVGEEMMRFSPMGWVMGPIREALWTENALQWQGVLYCLISTLVLYIGMSVVLNRREEF
ncbi:ABC transporter permease [Enterococcus songbeiensis]|uniref:ABC transporter permease n=1 Tax=Enterococcus songbeiensis TaxID=2559927 RepID=UPI0010F9FA49|nr:ABC transporter permease [Enterococcus songbeiensis]